MGAKFKYIAAAVGIAAAVAAAAAFLYLWPMRGVKEPLAYIPEPGGTAPYILLETKEHHYPVVLASLLTDGIYAHLKSDTPRGAVLAAAALAEEAAVLLERGADGAAAVYCAARFTDEETKLLQKGALPAPLDAAFGTESAEGADGVFAVRSEKLSEPFYYAVIGKNTLLAAELPALHKMISFDKGEGGLKHKKWTQEESWPAHIEMCDGGELSKKSKEKLPLTVEAAWREPEDETQPGEARWAFVNLGAAAKTYLSSALKAKKWDVSDCVLPQPLLLSAGFSLPQLKGSGEWPFPLSHVRLFAEGLGLSDTQIREILEGRTIISLGGQNKILWFSLPGFLAEFSGRPELMRELVGAFWNGLFYGVEPETVEGFEFGGSASVPFSVIGAGRGGTAVLGLASPQSVASGAALSKFLAKDEEAVGWLLADLPRVGKALSEMTKMSSFLEQEEDQDFYGGADDYSWGAESDPEPLQPEFSISPFDQEIADSFGGVLQRLGRVMVVWEKPLSGRINWYNQAK